MGLMYSGEFDDPEVVEIEVSTDLVEKTPFGVKVAAGVLAVVAAGVVAKPVIDIIESL